MIQFFSRLRHDHPLSEAVRSVREHLILCALFSAFYNFLILGPSIFSIQVYDRVVSSRSDLTLLFLTLVLILTLGCSAMLDNFRVRVMQRVGARFETRLRRDVFAAVIGTAREPGVRRGFRDVEVLRQCLSGPPFIAMVDAPWSVLFLCICFMINVWIGVLTLFGMILLAGLALLNERVMKAPLQDASHNSGQVSALSEIIGQSSDVVRALGMRDALAQRLSTMRRAASDSLLGSQLKGGRYQALTRFIRMFLQSASLGLGAFLVIHDKMSPGGMFAASMLVARALSPVEMLVGSWATVVAARSSWTDLAKLLDEVPSEMERVRLPKPRGLIEVENVSVALSPTQILLRDVTFRVEPGQVIGLVGPSGSGKTSLARVLAGIRKPLTGTVRLDGAEIGQWRTDQWCEVFGWSPQSASLLPGTIRANISRFISEFGGDAAEIDADVVTAAQAAGAHDMILSLPSGYETVVGAGGVGLSGGQAQRITLARALYRNPRFLLLDEPDAFLDADGEAALLRAIASAKAGGAAIILIGHKLQLLRAADQLIGIRDGRIYAASLTPQPHPAEPAQEPQAARPAVFERLGQA